MEYKVGSYLEDIIAACTKGGLCSVVSDNLDQSISQSASMQDT